MRPALPIWYQRTSCASCNGCIGSNNLSEGCKLAGASTKRQQVGRLQDAQLNSISQVPMQPTDQQDMTISGKAHSGSAIYIAWLVIPIPLQTGVVCCPHRRRASFAGGADLAQGDRDDLQQLDKAVRGRLLELQILKLSAQCTTSQAQHAALLDVGASTQPKVCKVLVHSYI